MKLKEILQYLYSIQGEITELYGEKDDNYYIKCSSDKEYLLKISDKETDIAEIEFQNSLITLVGKSKNINISGIISNTEGQKYSISEIDGQKRIIRLFTWVTGKLYSQVNPQNSELLASLGSSLANLTKALEAFDHPEAHCKFKWDIANAIWVKEYIQNFPDPEELEIAKYFLDLFEGNQNSYKTFRKSVIYNDANDNNIIVDYQDDKYVVKGFIDFGDVIYTQTINELAVCLAYALMHKNDPLEAASHIIKAYHKVFPIQEKEIEVLFSLIAARLLISVTTSSINKKKNPDNKYLVVSEKPAWDLLKKLKDIPQNFVHYYFRYTCGFHPCPKSLQILDFANNGKLKFGSIVENTGLNSALWLDLSVGSKELGNFQNYESDFHFDQLVSSIMKSGEKKIALGKYLETRPLYTTDDYMQHGNNGASWRTVHLGLDIFQDAGTKILSPYDGVVFSIQDNAIERDYGPTIIIKHRFEEIEFFTLYGHLSKNTLEKLSVGNKISKGQEIAQIGKIEENGGWPPHVHFQVICDMLGMTGNYPGVCFPQEKEIWESICPDPCVFLGINPPEENQLDSNTILGKRSKKLGKSLSISYNKPLHIVRGKMQYLLDSEGQRYLDMVNNVAHVGHENPRVVKAGQDQMAVLNTNTRYLNDEIVKFADELLETFPKELSVCHFVNSGSEANELAIRMAKAKTSADQMLVLEHGYHGNTNICVDLSSYKFDGKGGNGAPENTHVISVPDFFRGKYRGNNQENLFKYLANIDHKISNIKGDGKAVCAFIAESIMSCAGQMELPEEYLTEAYSKVRKAGGVCIADEVQVGMGRVGEKFWGFELHNVIPDIVSIGKPLGNGHPVAAVITTQEIAEAFANGMEYFNTFGGNPVSCAIGRSVLQEIKDQELQDNALKTGNYLLSELRKLQSDFPIIGEVRGKGLFIGLEMIKEDMIPASKEASYLVNRMKERKVLLSTDGPDENVIKIKPPMCFGKQNADFFLENLILVLRETVFTDATYLNR